MSNPIVNQVVGFYADLFERLFLQPFRGEVADLLKWRKVERQVEEGADAAAPSLARFFLSQQLGEAAVAEMLAGLIPLRDLLSLEDVANPNLTPESLAKELLGRLPLSGADQEAGGAPFRVALHSVVQTLTLIGPVMAEWRRLGFSTTFELPGRVVQRLNRFSENLGELGAAGQAAADERFELSYRDYLLQRFHRVEAGTVKMTTNLDVDLRELFVMPRVLVHPPVEIIPAGDDSAAIPLLDLAAARQLFTRSPAGSGDKTEGPAVGQGRTALEQVRDQCRNILIGLPGSGKSTFIEWLQLQIAAVEEELILAGEQAIPLLLRVRQLDPRDLPRGAALIEKAMASRDRASLMPLGWIERQMRKGRIILMIDGLDETEPELRDHFLLPWLRELCTGYPDCRYLLSSRPVGYPAGALRDLDFAECNLLDFGPAEVAEYTRHWCTAVRLSRNEPEKQARREGAEDGEQIVGGFQGHPYIENLARNPLMLSAICLVNYFEGGELPKDRAMLYRLCVEGLLHHWDQRRGIRSEFTLQEKLRACREVALLMQNVDRAEIEEEKLREVFAEALTDPKRGKNLLEQIRYRTGLLLERRPSIYAFAHLTFQEYLAASAVHEGNRLGIGPERLAREYMDGRWSEVIALYCGLAPGPAARHLLEGLVEQPSTGEIGNILAEAYLSAGPELLHDGALRERVINRIAVSPLNLSQPGYVLSRFPTDEVARITNALIGTGRADRIFRAAFGWLASHHGSIDCTVLTQRASQWRELDPIGLTEIVYLIHAAGPDDSLEGMAADPDIYSMPVQNTLQAAIALGALKVRELSGIGSPILDRVLLHILRAVIKPGVHILLLPDRQFFENGGQFRLPSLWECWPEYAELARRVAAHEPSSDSNHGWNITARQGLLDWADALDYAFAKRSGKTLYDTSPQANELS